MSKKRRSLFSRSAKRPSQIQRQRLEERIRRSKAETLEVRAIPGSFLPVAAPQLGALMASTDRSAEIDAVRPTKTSVLGDENRELETRDSLAPADASAPQPAASLISPRQLPSAEVRDSQGTALAWGGISQLSDQPGLMASLPTDSAAETSSLTSESLDGATGSLVSAIDTGAQPGNFLQSLFAMSAGEGEGTSMGDSPRSSSARGGGNGGGDSASSPEPGASGDTSAASATNETNTNSAASGQHDDKLGSSKSGDDEKGSGAYTKARPAVATAAQPFPDDLEGWTVQQLGGSEADQGTVTVESGLVTMREGDSYVVTLSHDFIVPEGAETLTFQYEGLNFDFSDPNSINDAFEAELVDESGAPLVLPHATDQVSFFNATEGEDIALGNGVEFTPAGSDSGDVSVDVSAIPPETVATIRFRLIGNDSDTETLVRLSTIGIPKPEQAEANDDQFTVAEDSSANFDVLFNDVLINGDLVSVSAGSEGGQITIATDDTIDYVPRTDFFGREVFQYTIANAVGDLQSAEVVVDVTPVNDPPTAVDDAYAVSNREGTLQLGVLENDSILPDANETLVIQSATDGTAGGSVSVSGTTLSYTPALGFVGTETFTYTINDGTPGSSATATVTIRSEGEPITASVSDLVGDEGETLTLTGSFIDPVNTEPHTVVIAWGDGSSTVAFTDEQNGIGDVLAQHAYADNGDYTIEMTVTDSVGSVVTATAMATIGNVAPRLEPAQTIRVTEGSQIRLTLGRATDPGFTNDGISVETFEATVDWGDATPVSNADVDVRQGADGALTVVAISSEHTYADDGQYTAHVTLTDDDGGTATTTITVNVDNASPQFLTGVGPRSPVGDPMQLQATFSDLGIDDTHTASINWGDGTTTTGSIVDSGGVMEIEGTHTYSSIGEFPVTIELEDDAGGSATLTVMATATETPDTESPIGTLVSPLPDSITNTDAGLIAVQWSDDRELDTDSIDVSDVTITGVTVTSATPDAVIDGLVTYAYDGTLSAGEVQVTLVEGQVSDASGNVNAESTSTFTFDPIQPSGALVSPAPSSVTNQDLQYVEIQWSDNVELNASSFDPFDVLIDGVTLTGATAVNSQGLVRYAYTGSLPEGPVTVTLVAGQVSDAAGNTNESATETFNYDPTAPTGTLVAPVPGSITNTDLGYVDIQWSDNADVDPTTFDTSDVQIGGVTITSATPLNDQGLVRYTYSGFLFVGDITVTLADGEVLDIAGNGNESSTETFTFDPIRPVGSLLQPSPDSITNLDVGYVEVQWADNIALNTATFDTQDVLIDGLTIDSVEPLTDGIVRYHYTGTPDAGPIEVTLVGGQVADTAGNTNETSVVMFTYDPIPPVGVLINPQPGSVTRDQGFVDIEWSDNVAVDLGSVDAGDVTITGVTIASATALDDQGLVRYVYDGELPEGNVTVALLDGAINDTAGNVNVVAEFEFTHDPFSPSGILVTPLAGSITNLDSGSIAIQWSDNEGIDPSSYGAGDVTIDGVTVTGAVQDPVTPGLVAYEYDGQLSNGLVTVTLVEGEVLDIAGNSNARSIATFTFDDVKPTGEVIEPASDAVINADPGYVTIVWSDDLAVDPTTIDLADVQVDGVNITGVSADPMTAGAYRYLYDGTPPIGTVNVTVLANAVADTAGNLNEEATSSFVFDPVAPVGELISPSPGSTTNVDQGYFDIKWSDNLDLNVNSIDVGDLTSSGLTIESVQELGGGVYRYSYGGSLANGPVTVALVADEVLDVAGNTNDRVAATFVFDSIEPTVELAAPIPDSFVNSDRGYVEIQWNDNLDLDEGTFDASDITVAGVTITNAVAVGSSGLVRYSYSGDLATGVVEVTAVAGQVADTAGNTNSESAFEFTYDPIKPSGTLTSPVPGSSVAIAPTEISIQWSDNLGLDEASIDATDITIPGVTIVSATPDATTPGLVHYAYSGDLAEGEVFVTLVGGAVSDEAGNLSDEAVQAFVFDAPNDPIDITEKVDVLYSFPQFNARFRTVSFVVTVTNTTTDKVFSDPLQVSWYDLSPHASAYLNDGVNDLGEPYYTFDATADGLQPGETSPPRLMVLKLAQFLPYEFSTRVTGVESSINAPEGEQIAANYMDYVFQSPTYPYDVNDDGNVTPADALAVINRLGRFASGTPDPTPAPLAWTGKFYDVDGSGKATPIDALQVINQLARDYNSGTIEVFANTATANAPADEDGPMISASLLNDSAPGGTTNSDRLTFDPTIVGTVLDASVITSFRAGLNESDASQYTSLDVGSVLSTDGSFRFDEAFLGNLNGTLDDGENRLDLIAEDEHGNVSSTFSVLFNLDRVAPAKPGVPTLIDDNGSDTEDGITSLSNPRIGVELLEPVIVALLVDGQTVAELPGEDSLQIASGLLAEGTNEVRVRVEDFAGNVSADSGPLSITLDTTPPAAASVDLAPASDTETVGDRITEAAIVTLIGQAEAGVEVLLEPGGLSTVADASGNFEFDDVALTIGINLLTVTTIDSAGNRQSAIDSIVRRKSIDDTPPLLSASLANDTGTSADRPTEFRSHDCWIGER